MDDRIHISIPFGLSFALMKDLEALVKKHAPNQPLTIEIRNEDWPGCNEVWTGDAKDQLNGQ